MKTAWVPYPAYTDRAAWDSLMGPNKQRLIAAGEKLLDYKWKLIPATAYLEYERSGNRKVMEAPYDANRQALNALMLAELAEGKGRFYRPVIKRSLHELRDEFMGFVCTFASPEQ